MLRRLAALLLTLAVALAPAATLARRRAHPAPKAADVYIVGSVTSFSVEEWVRNLEQVKEAGARHVILHITSAGGEAVAGIYFIEKVKQSGLDVTCVVEGFAMSMAAIIFESEACHERVVASSAILMFHGGRYIGGRSSDFPDARVQALDRATATLICNRTGWPRDEFLKLILSGGEVWLVGDEITRNHAADWMIPARKAAPQPLPKYQPVPPVKSSPAQQLPERGGGC